MNKLHLFCNSSITEVSFSFFNSDGNLIDTSVGSLNADSVWETTIPGTLPAETYTVIGKTGTKILGEEKIIWNGSSIVNQEDAIAQSVRDELSSELIHLVSLQNGLTAGQSTMLLEIYRLMGLDPTRPLVVTRTERQVMPEINQTLDDNTFRTIVTRIP